MTLQDLKIWTRDYLNDNDTRWLPKFTPIEIKKAIMESDFIQIGDKLENELFFGIVLIEPHRQNQNTIVFEPETTNFKVVNGTTFAKYQGSICDFEMPQITIQEVDTHGKYTEKWDVFNCYTYFHFIGSYLKIMNTDEDFPITAKFTGYKCKCKY